MATTPPPPEQPAPPPPAAPRGPGYGVPGGWDARMPGLGNAEFIMVALAAFLLAILAWVADGIDDRAWFTSFTAIVVAYLISRGIAKASRVLER